MLENLVSLYLLSVLSLLNRPVPIPIKEISNGIEEEEEEKEPVKEPVKIEIIEYEIAQFIYFEKELIF